MIVELRFGESQGMSQARLGEIVVKYLSDFVGIVVYVTILNYTCMYIHPHGTVRTHISRLYLDICVGLYVHTCLGCVYTYVWGCIYTCLGCMYTHV